MLQRLPIFLALGLCAATASADTLKLANGDVLTGEIVQWAVDYVVLDHAQLGEIRLSVDQLEIDTGTPPSPGLFGSRFLRGWNRSIDLGWTGRQGSTDTINITAGMNFGYEDEFKLWRLTARYFLNESSDGDSDNNARVDLRRDWRFPGHDWFAFSAFRYQFDEFEAWRHRTVLSVGPGYNLVKREAHRLDLRLAPTFTREFGDVQSQKGEALFGVDYRWTISSRSSIHFTNDFYAEWKPDPGTFRNLSVAEWSLRVAEAPALRLTIGGSNEYESDPEPGDKANDLRYHVSLGLDF